MLSIILFAYNERANIPPFSDTLTAWIEASGEEVEIIFVNDGSSDGSENVAAESFGEQNLTVVNHATNRGIGAAIKSGVEHASGEWVSFLPVDGQVPPEALTTLLNKQRRENADVVFSIYRNRNDGLHRKILSGGVRALITAIHWVRLDSDGPYLFRRSLFDPAQLQSDSFFLNFEFPIRACKAGLRTSVVEVDCLPRMHGQSKSANVKKVVTVGRELLGLRGQMLSEHARRVIGK